MYAQIKELEDKIKLESKKIEKVKLEINKSVVGQKQMVQGLLVGLLTGGHILLEGLPGLAKTLTVNSLARSVDLEFSRVQFTPDMLPADLIGTQIFHPGDGAFYPKKGPIFTNLFLADEINRAPAKVQSALLEVMQEQQVTLGGETHLLDKPFLVFATQNPIDQEGTYPLPEAQIDRFMMKLKIEYPQKVEEREILEKVTSFSQELNTERVLEKQDILHMKELIQLVYLDDKIKDYIVELVDASRNPDKYGLDQLTPLIELGASPRATITLAIAAKAHAFLNGKGYVTPQDIKVMAQDVLRHRILVSYEAEAEEKTSENIISVLLSEVPIT